MIELIKALIKAQSEFPEIAKNCTAKITATASYKYADLADVKRAVTPILNKNNLMITNRVFQGATDFDILETKLVHSSGESISSNYILGKDLDHKAMGAAITYGRRYNLQCLIDVAPDEDIDGPPKTEKPKQPVPPPNKITKEQMSKLIEMAKNKDWSNEQVKTYLHSAYKINEAKELDQEMYQSLMFTIDTVSYVTAIRESAE